MFELLLAFIILLSALFAVHLRRMIDSVISLAATFVMLSMLYFYLGAYFAAVFQLATGIGTAVVFLLMARVLSLSQSREPASIREILGITGLSLCLALILVEIKEPVLAALPLVSSVPLALWHLRVLDVLAQGVVMLVVSLGIGIVLTEEEGGN